MSIGVYRLSVNIQSLSVVCIHNCWRLERREQHCFLVAYWDGSYLVGKCRLWQRKDASGQQQCFSLLCKQPNTNNA